MGATIDLIGTIRELEDMQPELRAMGEHRKANMLDFAISYLKKYKGDEPVVSPTKDTPKRYTVGIVFDYSMEECLMLLTNHGPCPGKLNGVGGKIEDGETPDIAMAREFYEETGIPITAVDKVKFLVKMEFPSGVELQVYYIILSEIESHSLPPVTEVDEGHLIWIGAEQLTDASYSTLAGEGNVAYFINAARVMEGRR